MNKELKTWLGTAILHYHAKSSLPLAFSIICCSGWVERNVVENHEKLCAQSQAMWPVAVLVLWVFSCQNCLTLPWLHYIFIFSVHCGNCTLACYHFFTCVWISSVVRDQRVKVNNNVQLELEGIQGFTQGHFSRVDVYQNRAFELSSSWRTSIITRYSRSYSRMEDVFSSYKEKLERRRLYCVEEESRESIVLSNGETCICLRWRMTDIEVYHYESVKQKENRRQD